MKYTAKQKMSILEASARLTNALKVSKIKHKISDALVGKIVDLAQRMSREQNTTFVDYVDQIGCCRQGKIGHTATANMMNGMTSVLREIETNKFMQNHHLHTSIDFALAIKDAVDGIGTQKSMVIKALIDGCSKEDAIILAVMDDIICKGVKATGDKPWERTEGHSAYLPAQLVGTISHIYGLSTKDSSDLCKDLLHRKLICVVDEELVALPEVVKIEKKLKEFASTKTSPLNLCIDTTKLNDGQNAMVKAVNETEASIICVNAAGGTGKSHTCERIIEAVVEDCPLRSILVCAPTGMAAMTLEKFLRERGTDTEALVCKGVVTIDRVTASIEMSGSEMEADVVIFDECSMISTRHMRLLGLLKKDPQKIIMLGDLAQLKPIGIGSPFADCAKMCGFVTLTENMRAKGSPELLEELEKARNGYGIIHTYIPFAKSVRVADHSDVKTNLHTPAYAVQMMQLQSVLEGCVRDNIHILAHTNKLSDAIAHWYCAKIGGHDTKPYLDDVVRTYFGMNPLATKIEMNVPGMHVYWTGDRHGEKDAPKVYRGFAGVISEDGQTIEMEGTYQGRLSKVEIPYQLAKYNFQPWISRTIHKAQGQSMERIVIFVKALFGNYDQELHYTAHSRARNKATIISMCDPSKNVRLTPSVKRMTVITGRV